MRIPNIKYELLQNKVQKIKERNHIYQICFINNNKYLIHNYFVLVDTFWTKWCREMNSFLKLKLNEYYSGSSVVFFPTLLKEILSTEKQKELWSYVTNKKIRNFQNNYLINSVGNKDIFQCQCITWKYRFWIFSWFHL